MIKYFHSLESSAEKNSILFELYDKSLLKVLNQQPIFACKAGAFDGFIPEHETLTCY